MTISVSESNLLDLIAEHVASLLPPEKVEEIADRHIGKRIGQLTLDQAAKHLQCSNLRQLTDFCREHKIPLLNFGAKKRFILIADIESAQARRKQVLHATNS